MPLARARARVCYSMLSRGRGRSRSRKGGWAMPGMAVRAVKKQTQTFGATLAASAVSPEVTLAQNINVSQFRELVGMARLHSAVWGNSTGAKVELKIFASAPTDEDPSQLFRPGTPNPTPLATLTFTKGDIYPLLVLSSPISGFGTHVDIVVVFTQGTTASVAHTVSVSMDLSLKS